MLLEAFEPSPLPFSFSHHHAETRTHKEAVARVDACKWDGRGRRQNCGKLKLMNNRPPLPLFAPRPLLLLRNAGTRWKIVVEQRGVRLEYDGNDDIKARGLSPSSPPPLLFFTSSFGETLLSRLVTGDKCFFNEFSVDGIFFRDELCRPSVSERKERGKGWKLFKNLFAVCSSTVSDLILSKCLLIYSRPILARRRGHSPCRGLPSTVAISCRRAPSVGSTKARWNWPEGSKKSS